MQDKIYWVFRFAIFMMYLVYSDIVLSIVELLCHGYNIVPDSLGYKVIVSMSALLISLPFVYTCIIGMSKLKTWMIQHEYTFNIAAIMLFTGHFILVDCGIVFVIGVFMSDAIAIVVRFIWYSVILLSINAALYKLKVEEKI